MAGAARGGCGGGGCRWIRQDRKGVISFLMSKNLLTQR